MKPAGGPGRRREEMAAAAASSCKHKTAPRVKMDGGHFQRTTLFEHAPELVRAAIAAEKSKEWTGYDPRWGDTERQLERAEKGESLRSTKSDRRMQWKVSGLTAVRVLSRLPEHTKFMEYLKADESEDVGEVAELRMPWITPRRLALETETSAPCARESTLGRSVPAHVKYRAANVPACIVTTVEPCAEDRKDGDGVWLSPRCKTGCEACHGPQEGRGLRRGKQQVGEVKRLANPRSGIASDHVMWSLASHVLAKNGIEHDKRKRPFYTDKFTGQRVYMLRPLERQHDTSLYDTKRNAQTPKTARLKPSPTGTSDLRTKLQGEPQVYPPNFFDIKQQLTHQQGVWKNRLEALIGLKKTAFAHAAELAAEHRDRFEKQVRWEMHRLDQEIQNMARRLQECTQEVTAVDSAGRRRTPC